MYFNCFDKDDDSEDEDWNEEMDNDDEAGSEEEDEEGSDVEGEHGWFDDEAEEVEEGMNLRVEIMNFLINTGLF